MTINCDKCYEGKGYTYYESKKLGSRKDLSEEMIFKPRPK